MDCNQKCDSHFGDFVRMTQLLSCIFSQVIDKLRGLVMSSEKMDEMALTFRKEGRESCYYLRAPVVRDAAYVDYFVPIFETEMGQEQQEYSLLYVNLLMVWHPSDGALT